jgi:phospholipase C
MLGRPFALLPLLALAACSSSVPTGAPSDDGGVDSGNQLLPVPEWDRAVTPPDDGVAATSRAACGFAKGALPAETLGKSAPTGKAIPLDTLVVVMMENRSFDHIFQKLHENGHADAEVAPADFSNPAADGSKVTIFHDTKMCFVDTHHEWTGVHQQVGDKGAMDGFVKSNEGWGDLPPHGTSDMLSGARAMGYYEKADVPFMYWAADNFAIGDRYFCSLLGPTWPNRMYLYAATSFGRTSNVLPDAAAVTLFDNLEKRGVTWKIYSSGTPGLAVIADRVIQYSEHIADIDSYYTDAAAGTLPQVAFVDPKIADERYDQNDEHPPAIVEVGDGWLAGVTKALVESPQWSRAALFITYDEHGGLWDHVPPPKACPPGDFAPLPPATSGQAFDQLGIRVPFLVVSPYAKRGYVGHHVYDHTSIVRFIEAKYTLPAMTGRDANAEAPFDLFDFTASPGPKPASPALTTVDAKVLADCKAIYVK